MIEESRAECLLIARELVEDFDASKASAASTRAKLDRLARLLGKADLSGDLEARIRSWLSEQGFPLEFRVARAFAAHGFEVTPSHYVDVDDSVREIDVLAIHSHHMMGVRTALQFYVECKWSRSRPWVVFSHPTKTADSSPIWRTIPHNVMGEGLLWCLAEVEDFLREMPIAAIGVGGYAGRQALTSRKPDDPDAFYSAMQSVTALARAGVRDRTSLGTPRSLEVRLAFPVVVIDAPLFAATLPADSHELHLEGIQRARVHWRGASADVSSLVDIVTADGLDTFIQDCLGGIKRASDWIGMVHSEMIQALSQDSPEPIAHRFLGRTISPPNVVPVVLGGLAMKYAATHSASP